MGKLVVPRLARASDGSRIEISSAMIPITTSNSTTVNPRALCAYRDP